MPNLKEQIVLDVKVGNVIEKDSRNKVILKGNYLEEGSEYVDNLEISIDLGNNSNHLTTKINYSGYNMQLFLGDFNKDGRDEIMLRGAYGGSGGFAIVVIYSYSNGNLKEIFNPNMFSEKYDFDSEYLSNYKVQVVSNKLSEKFIFCIENKSKAYLDIIYGKDGKVKIDENPTVSAINNAFPIKSVYEETYYIFIRQRVIGLSNSDTIGVIESFINLIDDEINLFNIGSFNLGEKITDKKQEDKKIIDDEVTFIHDSIEKETRTLVEDLQSEVIFSEDIYGQRILDEEKIVKENIDTIKTTSSLFIDFYNEKSQIKNSMNIDDIIYKTREENLRSNVRENISKELIKKFPLETNFININPEGENETFIKEDLDNDGIVETLVPYLLNDCPYIGVVQENADNCILKANFRGEGCNIEDLVAKKIGKNFYVFIGFKINKDLNKLYVLKLIGGKLSKISGENEYYYNKMYLKDLNKDCNSELILWKENEDGGHNISIYNVKENGLIETNKYDKKYYKEVVEYYKGKIKSYEEETIYPYYLALAYEKRGEYKKALAVVEKALDTETPYPSKHELEKFKKRLKKLIK